MGHSGGIKTIHLYFKLSIAILLAIFFISGCANEDSSFKAIDGEYSIGTDIDTGGYFEVVDNKIYNLTLSMENPPSDESCQPIVGATFIRPGETDPYMEFVNPVSTHPVQEMIYFDPLEIDDNRKFIVEESFSVFCEQAFTISGTFDNFGRIVGTWKYTIDGQSTTGPWWANLLSTNSGVEPISLITASIVIDGDRSDWQGIQPILSDEEGDENPDANFDGSDINAFYMARDDEFLYHLITLHDADPPADRNIVYSINYDKYPLIGGDSVPGDQGSAVFLSYPPGGNMVVDFGERTIRARDSSLTVRYNSDYAAIGDKFIEYKIPLEDMKSIDGAYIDIYAHMLDTDDDGLLIYNISDIMDGLARIDDSGGGYKEEGADVIILDGGYIQYRTFSDGNNFYRGWIEFTKNGKPGDELDISNIQLKDGSGNIIPISDFAYYRESPYFGDWNDAKTIVEFSKPYPYSGLSINFPQETNLSSGIYIYEVLTSDGDLLSMEINFQGEVTMPFVAKTSMTTEELQNGDIFFTWESPVGDFDEYRLTYIDQNFTPFLYVKLPTDATEFTLPQLLRDQLYSDYNPSIVYWEIQTRIYNEDLSNNYARGYSGTVDITNNVGM